jgi:plasmid stabilization system protein ParE
MAKEVILTPIAVNDFENVVDYLTHKWGIPTANNFVDRFEKVSLLLSKDASIFPFVNMAKQIQKCILTKHNVLYFKETAETVKILTIFDTRQDSEKLNSFF